MSMIRPEGAVGLYHNLTVVLEPYGHHAQDGHPLAYKVTEDLQRTYKGLLADKHRVH